METKYKTIPFDVNRINEEGVKVVTRDGESARILCTDCRDKDAIKLVVVVDDGSYERVVKLYKNGKYYNDDTNDADDLFIVAPYKYRRMTNQELAWWLRDCPEEHREWKRDGTDNIYQTFEYDEYETYDECDKHILIRRNGGAWEEPLIEN